MYLQVYSRLSKREESRGAGEYHCVTSLIRSVHHHPKTLILPLPQYYPIFLFVFSNQSLKGKAFFLLPKRFVQNFLACAVVMMFPWTVPRGLLPRSPPSIIRKKTHQLVPHLELIRVFKEESHRVIAPFCLFQQKGGMQGKKALVEEEEEWKKRLGLVPRF